MTFSPCKSPEVILSNCSRLSKTTSFIGVPLDQMGSQAPSPSAAQEAVRPSYRHLPDAVCCCEVVLTDRGQGGRVLGAEDVLELFGGVVEVDAGHVGADGRF